MPPYTRISEDTKSAIASYAKLFHEKTLDPSSDENYVASPLGSWLLLATLAAATDFSGAEDAKRRVEETLGLSVSVAEQEAKALLGIDGAEVAIGAWFNAELPGRADRIAYWLDTNRLATAEGRIPSQGEMDAWTNRLTHGLIEKFPLDVTPDVVFMVATVVYTKFDWYQEYEVVHHSHAPVSGWSVDKILYSNNSDLSFYELKEDADVILAVHTRFSQNDQIVYSVVPIAEELTDSEILEYAQEISERSTRFTRLGYEAAMHRLGLAELSEPSTTSGISFTYDTEATAELASVWLPAWEADNKHDLTADAFAFGDVVRTLAIGSDEIGDFDAMQAVVAKYGAKGFEAAAVTGVSVLRSAVMPARGHYAAHLSFNRTFAAVCVVAGLPLFSAVVRGATEA